MSYPPQTPTPPQGYMPAPVPVTKKSRNILGIVALIASIVGFVFACIPGALIVGWVLLPISFILGLVALFRKDESHGQAIAAIIVAVVGTVVGVVVFLTVVGNAFDEAFPSEGTNARSVGIGSSSGANPSEGATSTTRAGTRDNPVPLGTEISSKDWKVVVNSVTFDANDAVLAENMFNDPPADGQEYILVNYEVTYIGNDPNGESPILADVSYVSADGVTIDSSDSLAVAPDAIDISTTLYNGGSVSGNVALSVPSATARDGVLAVEPGLVSDKTFVAVK